MNNIIIDRTKAPKINEIKFEGLPKYQSGTLTNGLPWYGFHNPDYAVARFEINVPGGTWAEDKNNQALFTSQMFLEGTKTMDGKELSEKIDFLGAFINVQSNIHFTSFSIYALKDKLGDALDILKSIICEPAFNKNDLEILKSNLKQEYIINCEKTKFVAKNNFYQLLYGKNNGYGKKIEASDFDNITVDDLNSFYNKLDFTKAKIYISSCLDQQLIDTINDKIGSLKFENKILPEKKFIVESNKQKIHFIEKKDAQQSSIYIGKQVISRDNPDISLLILTNTILGGYFGSRLMTKIREEKGLTYGIYSQVNCKLHSGDFVISADVIADKSKLAVNEIFSEINRLTNTLVDPEELQRVKNYILGAFARGMNNPFSPIDYLKIIHASNLNDTFHSNLAKEIHNATATDIQNIMRKYLNPEEMYILTVGKK